MALTLAGLLQSEVERVDVFPVSLVRTWQEEVYRIENFLRQHKLPRLLPTIDWQLLDANCCVRPGLSTSFESET